MELGIERHLDLIAYTRGIACDRVESERFNQGIYAGAVVPNMAEDSILVLILGNTENLVTWDVEAEAPGLRTGVVDGRNFGPLHGGKVVMSLTCCRRGISAGAYTIANPHSIVGRIGERDGNFTRVITDKLVDCGQLIVLQGLGTPY